MQWFKRISYLNRLNLNARVDVNCGRKDGQGKGKDRLCLQQVRDGNCLIFGVNILTLMGFCQEMKRFFFCFVNIFQ